MNVCKSHIPRETEKQNLTGVTFVRSSFPKATCCPGL